MKLLKLAWLLPLAVCLVALLPPTSASTPTHASSSAPVVRVHAPVHGLVTNCTSTVDCTYAFNTSAGAGWAKSTGFTLNSERMAVQLPGELLASSNLSYSTYIAKLTGTYTYWTVGTFVGTDVNSGYVVLGTTNTNYTITCVGHSGRGGGCTYIYTTDNGTIVVKFTHQELTSSSIVCSPTSFYVVQKTTCTVSVTNDWNASLLPTGTVRISDARLGSLSDKGACALVNGTCSFTFRPFDNTCGSVVIWATYPGASAFYRSLASTAVDVMVQGGC
ncbi:MAG TPA: hypothetical protein VGV89_10800 [Thermoplasmata archaeon]|nr:hypothetical protein [Thermoplasmata archaeon]